MHVFGARQGPEIAGFSDAVVSLLHLYIGLHLELGCGIIAPYCFDYWSEF